MDWDFEEALEYYRKQGAPGDQNAVRSLLKEVQQALGSVPGWAVARAAQAYGTREGLFLALIRRTPTLRLGDQHVLEICGGPNCAKKWTPVLKNLPENVTVRTVPCMRLCGKGPNIRLDGTLHSGMSEEALRKLLENLEK